LVGLPSPQGIRSCRSWEERAEGECRERRAFRIIARDAAANELNAVDLAKLDPDELNVVDIAKLDAVADELNVVDLAKLDAVASEPNVVDLAKLEAFACNNVDGPINQVGPKSLADEPGPGWRGLSRRLRGTAETESCWKERGTTCI
jgi:hypothetical protein